MRHSTFLLRGFSSGRKSVSSTVVFSPSHSIRNCLSKKFYQGPYLTRTPPPTLCTVSPGTPPSGSRLRLGSLRKESEAEGRVLCHQSGGTLDHKLDDNKNPVDDLIKRVRWHFLMLTDPTRRGCCRCTQ